MGKLKKYPINKSQKTKRQNKGILNQNNKFKPVKVNLQKQLVGITNDKIKGF